MALCYTDFDLIILNFLFFHDNYWNDMLNLEDV